MSRQSERVAEIRKRESRELGCDTNVDSAQTAPNVSPPNQPAAKKRKKSAAKQAAAKAKPKPPAKKQKMPSAKQAAPAAVAVDRYVGNTDADDLANLTPDSIFRVPVNFMGFQTVDEYMRMVNFTLSTTYPLLSVDDHAVDGLYDTDLLPPSTDSSHYQPEPPKERLSASLGAGSVLFMGKHALFNGDKIPGLDEKWLEDLDSTTATQSTVINEVEAPKILR